MSVKGYKVFNPDWTCRDFQYEVGKTFKHDGNIEMCGAGFHFCQKISDCFNYYSFDSNNKVAEVEATGLVETQNNKSVTNEIKIIRELTWQEVLDLVNTGKGNTGYHNTGYFNSGDYNTGHYNKGNRNSGDYNSGTYNTGYFNSGDYNTGGYNNGYYNAGRYNEGGFNTGNYNTGNYNTGDWNSADFTAGFFNSIKQPLYVFNKPTNISKEDFYKLPAIKAMMREFESKFWVYAKNMTDEEKSSHPDYETTGGYFKIVDYKTACSLMWENMTDDERTAVKDIPNFDATVFKEITGIEVV